MNSFLKFNQSHINQINGGTIAAADIAIVVQMRPWPSSDPASVVVGIDPSIVPSYAAVAGHSVAYPWQTAVPFGSALVELIAITVAGDGPGHQELHHLACFLRNRAVYAQYCLL